ncbi:MAG: hypothetical protein JXA93_17810 [Anaerolineae bacterium]|nr:hypothetical protein [Anaerolineae bacterium]
MFFGHIAVGLAAKPVAPRAPLGALLVAATAIDTLSGVFAVVGLETIDAAGNSSIPWSHGLLMAVVWSIAGFVLAYLLLRDRQAAAVLGLVVFSHWILDFISHPMGLGQELPPDLPLLFEGSPKVGLGLYNSVPLALITEFGLFAAGIAVYLLTTRAQDRTGKWAFWAMLLFVFLLILPVAVPQLALLPVFATLLLLPIGNWVDRHRPVVQRKDTAYSVMG